MAFINRTGSAFLEVYKQFDIGKSAGHYSIGDVITPDRIHALPGMRETGKVSISEKEL